MSGVKPPKDLVPLGWVVENGGKKCLSMQMFPEHESLFQEATLRPHFQPSEVDFPNKSQFYYEKNV